MEKAVVVRRLLFSTIIPTLAQLESMKESRTDNEYSIADISAKLSDLRERLESGQGEE